MYKCRRCGASFEKSTALGGHVVSCGRGQKIRCDICGDRITKSQMRRHLEIHKKDTKCPSCGRIIRARDRKKFCSHSCAAQFNNRAKGHKPLDSGPCEFCGGQKEKGRRFCSTKCRNDFRYQSYIEKWLKGDTTGRRGELVSRHVRTWLLNRSGGRCEGLLDDGSRCGWSRKNPYTGRVPLTVHHKDGHYENNVPHNLEYLCPNCHSLTSTYGNQNKGSGRRNRYRSA